MKIKAISLTNGWGATWATWIAEGRKTLETRTWATRYRGPLLICASKRPRGPHAGCALCVVDLVNCRPMQPNHENGSDEWEAMCPWEPGRVAWVLANRRPLPCPIPVKGSLGVFTADLPDEVARQIGLLPANPDLADLDRALAGDEAAMRRVLNSAPSATSAPSAVTPPGGEA